MRTVARALEIDGSRSRWLLPWLLLGLVVGAAGAFATRAAAQDEAPPVALASPEELTDIVGPIALYPDDLVALVLPASTYPLQVVQAARLLEDRKSNPNLQPREDWDDSVVALLNYPEVVALLNDDLDWTYDLGAAVLNQRADVLDAIQGFRDRAYSAGNLRTDDRQTVSRDDGAIAIKPANPQVIYVPYYEPERVVVYQTVPVYHYYPWRYPVYYYPYPAGYAFETGFFWGVRSWFSVGWNTRYLHVYDYGYRAHPYFGWNYYDPWFVRRNVYVNVNVNRGYVWEPRYRYGGRPVVRGYEGRVYTSREAPRVSRVAPSSTYRSRSTEGAIRNGSAARSTARIDPRAGVNGNAGSSYRSRVNDGAARVAPRSDPRVEGGGTYRSRGAESPTRVAPRSDPRVTREPGSVARQRADVQPSTRERAYRGGSNATTQPRESGRGAYAPGASRSAPAMRAPSNGGGIGAAPRGDGGYRGGAASGGYRGDSGSGARGNAGGGQYRGGSGQGARGSEGRSAAR
jgi:hypothetical protein